MTDTFLRWGNGLWGLYPLFTYDPDDNTYETYFRPNTQLVWEAFDNEAVDITEGDPLYHLLSVLQTEPSRFDNHMAKQYKQLFVATATGPFLDRIAYRYNLHRQDGESDDRLRQRIRAAIAAATSESTFEYFASVVLFVLEANPDEVKLLPPSQTGNPATITISVASEVLDETEFTESEIVALLNESVPAGGSVELRSDGTFQFDGDNFTPDANTGFGEGTFGGAYQ